MNIGVCYAEADRQLWMRIDVPDGSNVGQAISLSGILQQFPEIDLEQQKVGIFGKLTKLDVEIKEGDRIEIYRQITADPKQVKRRKIATE